MGSYLTNSTRKTSRKPELEIWDKYLESFLISEKELIKWIDRKLKYGEAAYCSELLRELKNKIKD